MFPVSDVIPSRTTPFVTIGLISASALVFLYELLLDHQAMANLSDSLGVVPAEFAWSRVVTSIFVHDGWIHFGGNMLCLWIFGDNIEDAMGRGTFLLFYVTSAIGALVAQASLQASSTIPIIGASGAVASVMGAYFVLYPRSQVLAVIFLMFYVDVIEVPAIFLLGIWLVLQLMSSAHPVDAFAGPIVGFVVGGAVGLVLRQRARVWD
jgi:membrane associated rhomboid family serine protease